MEWSDFFAALALYLILEGLLPFASPGRWRESFALIARLDDSQMRIFGAVSIAMGLLLLFAVRG